MLDKAISIAVSAHYGQEDRNGQPYILHVFRVMLKGQTDIEKTVGVLHDVIEDTEWTLDGLRKEGFSEEIVAAIDALTRRDTETYEEFIARIMENKLAVQVKFYDLEDNMNVQREKDISPEDVQRFQRYLKAYQKLQQWRLENLLR